MFLFSPDSIWRFKELWDRMLPWAGTVSTPSWCQQGCRRPKRKGKWVLVEHWAARKSCSSSVELTSKVYGQLRN